jgi:glyoxylase-like metal-dependent hydrolase (beta-lactamase superfamily II)
MYLGSLEVHLVSDGVVWVDPGGLFGLVPRALWGKTIQPDEKGRIPMALTCLLLRSGGKTIVVDTGLGEKLTEKQKDTWGLQRPEGSLLEGLARLGCAPEDVDIVLNTHLHWDHCGGNTLGGQAKPVPTFPRAEYITQRLEFADAATPNERTRATYLSENFMSLVQEGQMRLLHGDTRVTDEVRAVITRGHTRGHMSVLLESAGLHGLYVADLATYATHFEKLGWMTAYDVEPLETLETKRQWQKWALERDALLIFEHDTYVPIGRLKEEEGKMKIERVMSDP